MKYDHGGSERAHTVNEGAVGKTAAGPAAVLVAQAPLPEGGEGEG